MSAGYQKAARLLRELDGADREWMLGQFSADERARLERAMASVGAPETPATPAHNAKPHDESAVDEKTAVATLAAADVAVVTTLLQGEPDWIVALVLMYTAWPWLPRFLAQRPAVELDRYERLARELEPRVKPAVRQAVIDACVRRLHSLHPPEPEPTPFERLVAAARRRIETARAPAGAE